MLKSFKYLLANFQKIRYNNHCIWETQMIDRDGIERPDKFDQHMRPITHDTRKIKFDDKYSYRPRNIFFRMWAGFFRALVICVLNPIFHFKYKMKVYGKKNMKKLRKKGFIIACNHCFLFDDLGIGVNVFPFRKVYFGALDRSMRRPLVGFYLRSLGGIPIPSSSLSGMKKFNEDVGYLLRKNKPVIIDPEGSLWPYYRDIRPFKRGAFSLAVKNDVPVLPMVLTFKRKQKKNGKFKYKVYYTACEPVYANSEILEERKRIEDVLNRTRQIMIDTADEFYKSQDCGFEN